MKQKLEATQMNFLKLQIKKKISQERVQQAYAIEEYRNDPIGEDVDQQPLFVEDALPEGFYNVLGKILTFLEKADVPLESRAKEMVSKDR
ncbi:hypothetical protein QBE52_03200 [Clostridiaceae bacterium 35-E11]